MSQEEPFTTVLDGCALEGRAVARRYFLNVVEGPDAGQRFVVDEGEGDCRALIGQSPACRIRLSDPMVSRRHASVEVEEGGLHFIDLGSTNGSKVNGLVVYGALLQGGDRIQVGGSLLMVQSGDPLEVPLPGDIRFGKVLGLSQAMRRLFPLFARVAASDIPVVIEGETGTGKEVLAESIHETSPRSNGPFVVFDCTTVSPSLVESTLFGHERGAFTSAVTSQAGLFEEADGGTLFIDEVGDLDLALQAKLLRGIERHEVRRVGAKKWKTVNVRILAATRRDLDREIQAGRFRDDLFFRLAVARLELPPLRKRHGDISVLATAFWRDMGGDPEALSQDFLRRLEAYEWPGNVRELRNAIAKRLALGDDDNLPSPVSSSHPLPTAGSEDIVESVLRQDLAFAVARQRVLQVFERRYVERVLQRHHGQVGRAAEAAGIGRRYFQRIRGRGKS